MTATRHLLRSRCSCPSCMPTSCRAVGTNVLRVWEFDTRLRLGRFRPHHGFVFGSATAMLALPAHRGTPACGSPDARQADGGAGGLHPWRRKLALRRVALQRRHSRGSTTSRGPTAQPAWTIASDYAPWFFGGFGLIYGAGLKFAEGSAADGLVESLPRRWCRRTRLAAAMHRCPTLGYVLQSYRAARPSAAAALHPPCRRPSNDDALARSRRHRAARRATPPLHADATALDQIDLGARSCRRNTRSSTTRRSIAGLHRAASAALQPALRHCASTNTS